MELAQTGIKEINGRDRNLYDRLVEKHYRRAYNIAFRMSGDHAEAEDLTQESFVRAFMFFDHYKQNLPFENWFFRIMLNVFSAKLRKKPKVILLSLDSPVTGRDNDYIAELADKQSSPEEIVLMHERENKIQKALMSMPDIFRLAVIYVDIEGMSYEEIAEATNTNIGTVRSRIYRGRRMLKELLDKVD